MSVMDTRFLREQNGLGLSRICRICYKLCCLLEEQNSQAAYFKTNSDTFFDLRFCFLDATPNHNVKYKGAWSNPLACLPTDLGQVFDFSLMS